MPSVRAKMEVFRLSYSLLDRYPNYYVIETQMSILQKFQQEFWLIPHWACRFLDGSSQKAKKLKSNKCRLSKNLVTFRGWNLAIGLMNKYWTGKHQLPRSCSLPAGIFGGCPSISKLSFSFGQTFFLRFSFDWKIFCLIAGTSGAHFRVFGDFSFSSQHN